MGLEKVLQAIEDARRLGLRFTEIEGVGTQLHTIAQNKASIKKKCLEVGVKVIVFVPVLPDLMNMDERKRKTALADYQLGCEVASFLDAGMVEVDTFYPPIYADKPYDISQEFGFSYQPPKLMVEHNFDFWTYFNEVVVDSMAKCNDLAASHGLRLCVEPRTWETISNAWAMEVLLREIHSNSFGAVLDTAHLACQKTPLVQAVEMLGKRIFYVHASDNNFMTEDHLEIGKGSIDWVSLLKVLEKQGYHGVFGLDIGGRTEFRDRLDEEYIHSKNYLEAAALALSKRT